jgi:hypothetical protein
MVALAMAAQIGAGCSNGSAENGSTGSGGGNANTANRKKAAEFSECMRDNGISEFPDPDASGELTIDGVLNGSSLDASTPAWKEAIRVCKDLQPPGFTGDEEVTAKEREVRLEEPLASGVSSSPSSLRSHRRRTPAGPARRCWVSGRRSDRRSRPPPALSRSDSRP